MMIKNVRTLVNMAIKTNKTGQIRMFQQGRCFNDKKIDDWAYLLEKTVDKPVEPTKPEPTNESTAEFTKVSRPLDSTASEITSTEKERMIFSKIFDSILAEKTASTSGKGPKPFAHSLKALFEESSNDNNRSNVNLETGLKFFKSGVSLDRAMNENHEKLAEQQKKIRYFVTPVLEHLRSLNYDYQVVDYYKKKILDRFTVKKSAQPIPSGQSNAKEPELMGLALPIYLLQCMEILIKDFRDPAQALSLFELSKRHSIEFYAHSCTADVYNCVIRIRWEYYRDLYAVETILSEMQVNAVLGNAGTVDLLSRISRDAIDAKHGMLESNNTALWNREDEQRVQKLGQYKLRILSSIPSGDPMSVPLRFSGV